jgi:hypothetical protein
MGKEFNNYSPDRVSFAFRGISITTGYAENTFIEAERNEDGFKMYVGALGDVTRTRILDHTGKVQLTLMAASPFNDLLNAVASEDEQFGLAFGPLQIMDHSGGTEVHSVNAWIQRKPKIERAKEAGTVVWMFACADIEINARGNVI